MTGPVLPGLAEALAAAGSHHLVEINNMVPECVQQELDDLDARPPVSDVCDACGGTGWFNPECDNCWPCSRCGGLGYLP